MTQGSTASVRLWNALVEMPTGIRMALGQNVTYGFETRFSAVTFTRALYSVLRLLSVDIRPQSDMRLEPHMRALYRPS
jgi:hypothetical protein